MLRRIIRGSIKQNRLITAAITAFILLAALLISLAASLAASLLGAIDTIMAKAETPDYLQMHTGDIDTDRLRAFAESQSNVSDFQILEFLNIEGADIAIGDGTLTKSIQDNGLSVQSKRFDFLLDLDNRIIQPEGGEIYVPVYYQKEGLARVGDTAVIHGVSLKVAGFLRDSQMNTPFASSKRFLVSRNDFEKIRPYGGMEYLIEFRLHDNSATPALEAAYQDAGLEANGPSPITYALFRLVNAIDDGITIALLMLVAILVLVVSSLSIRLTLLATIEEEYREIGVLKAIGLRVSYIKRLYLAKYGAIALAACILGYLLSFTLNHRMTSNIRLYMGASGSPYAGALSGLFGVALIFLIVILYVNALLHRFRNLPAAQAIRFGAPKASVKMAGYFRLSKRRLLPVDLYLGIKDVLSRKKLYMTLLLILIISTFIMIVPRNIYTTISSRSFMAGAGIGNCDLLIGIRQTEDIRAQADRIAAAMTRDADIARFTVLTTYMFDLHTDDGQMRRFKVELGDHTAFPLTYAKGRAPGSDDEIAISALNADELEKEIGDSITLTTDGTDKRLTICGIYSDITNGGRTAKAAFPSSGGEVLWSTIPVTLTNHADPDTAVLTYKTDFPSAEVSDIDTYFDQTFGSTAVMIRDISYAAITLALLLCALITVLFMKMLIAKDRYAIAVLKSLGFTAAAIDRQYLTRAVFVLIPGIAAGTVLAGTLGELAALMFLSNFGVAAFDFVTETAFTYLAVPAMMLTCVFVAAGLGITEIRTLKVSAYIKEN